MANKLVWLAGLSLGALSTGVLAAGLMSRASVAQSCSNFWVNPTTGVQECLDEVSAPSSTVPRGDNGAVAGRNFVAGQVIVGYRDGMDTRGLVSAAQSMGATFQDRISGPGGAILLEFASEDSAQQAMTRLRGLPGVLFVERNGIMRVPPQPQNLPVPASQRRLGASGSTSQPVSQGTVGINAVSADPGTGSQWHLSVIRKTAALPTLVSNPPTVAVIDTGVDYTHPDLLGTNKVIKGLNTIANNNDPFDDNGHGTHVAGLIAARAGNGQYGEGVCSNCRILAIKALGSDGSGTWFDVAKGMAFARTWTPPTGVPRVRVINMSLGGGDSSLIRSQVSAIKSAGLVLVAAAGNDNNDPDYGPSYPGADPNTALRVMATEQQDCRAFFSNFSPAATPSLYNIAAPGWNTPSTIPDSGYAPLSGTSMASPIVAGAAALVWGQNPSLTSTQLTSRLVSNGKSIQCGFPTTVRRLDVRRALTLTAETSLIGRLLDPFTGKAPSPNNVPTSARLLNGTTQVKVANTSRSGFYEMTALSTGTRTLRGDRATSPTYGSAATLRSLSIASSIVNGPFTDAIPLRRATGNATITLDWKNIHPAVPAPGCTSTLAAPGSCLGWEFDLYVKTPAGQYIGWGNGTLAAAPYVKSGRDSSMDLDSPNEGIVIGSQAANGVYHVFVDRWTSEGLFNQSYTGSQASVQMYNGASPVGTIYGAPPSTCGTNRFWYVGRLTKNGTSYTWTNVNTCSNTNP